MEEAIESYGTCTKCRKEAVLGEGLCVDCWDAREESVQEFQRRDKEEDSRIDRILGLKKVAIGERIAITKEDTPELLQSIDKLLSSLTFRQRRIIVLRFGLGDKRGRTLEEIGLEFNLSRERIRQIEGKSLLRLRWQCYFGNSQNLKIYLTKEEPTTLGEMLLKAIFSVGGKRRYARRN